MRDGVAVLIDRAHPANSNVMVIDAEVVLTGSFGFTVAADRESAENLLVIHAPALAARYGENWQVHAAHSVRYTSAHPAAETSDAPGGHGHRTSRLLAADPAAARLRPRGSRAGTTPPAG